MSIIRSVDSLDVVDLVWDGPFSMQDVERDAVGPSDYGLYQVYGSHGSGSDQLLYLGRATESTLSQRITKHREWTDWEPKSVEVYLGRLGGIIPLPPTQEALDEWGRWICRAEAILIYFTSPPFNSSGIRNVRELSLSPMMVLNFKRRHRLPAVVTNLYEKSPVSEAAREWNYFYKSR